MKKILYTFAALLILKSSSNAGVVVQDAARNVGANFYRQNTGKQTANLSLTYTELSATGQPVYYVFNVNGKEGFIIISAEDAGRPVIGYSTEGNYVIPSETSNAEFNFWMQGRKSEIEAIRTANLQADARVSKEWSDYATNKVHNPGTMSTIHPPLVESKWNQSGGGVIPYNKFCPGGSVTGCVATTMAQIMRYWGYPTQGVGTHSYSAGSYGTQTANFAKTYDWANMSLIGSNANVAQLSYDCGVSVNMNYSPSESAAYVCGSNPTAEYSYKTYFKYDPTLHCVAYSNYTTDNWNALLVAEFAAGRPVQYVGVDPGSGGHTWVADGNDAQDNIHQNWGWGGNDDGYYVVTALTPTGYNFSTSMSALIGIKPPVPAVAVDAGTYIIASPVGITCNGTFSPSVTIKNFGSGTLTSCSVNYSVDGGSTLIYPWSGTLASFQTATISLPSITVGAGAHTFTAFTSDPNGSTDGNTSNDQLQSKINITATAATTTAPYSEGFEAGGFPYADIYISNPVAGSVEWNTTTTAAATGNTSLELNNFMATSGDMDEFTTPAMDLSGLTGSGMNFKLAHAQRSAGDADILTVYTSIDCGNWIQRYSKSGAALANAGVSASAFTPSSSQWRQETVNIANTNGQSSVRFKFQYTSTGAGNNVFIDDINITGVAGVSEEFVNGFDLNVFPNPFADNTTISFNTLEKYNVSVGLFDVVGKEVIKISNTSQLNAGSYSLPLNRSGLKAGIYFVKLTADGYSVLKKVVVQ